jgi:lipoprotein signal peptidase
VNQNRLPSWKVRRKVIFLSVFTGVGMIIAGAVGLFQDRVTGELVAGGVALVSIVVTAYASMATLDDKWHFKPDEEYERENPDG